MHVRIVSPRPFFNSRGFDKPVLSNKLAIMIIVKPENKQEVQEYLAKTKPTKALEVFCAGCDSKIIKERKRIQAAVKNNTSMFCSIACMAETKSKQVTTEHLCGRCSKKVLRTRSELAKVDAVYCSQSCAAKMNNAKFVKRVRIYPDRFCLCGAKVLPQSNQCKPCWMAEKTESSYDRLTLVTLFDYKSNSRNESYRYYNKIRQDARCLATKHYNMVKECQHCGYSIAVELAHIRALSTFPDSATGAEMNARENLVYLCPNHHKEQEKGLIDIKIQTPT